MTEPHTITKWLHKLREGDESALEQLMPLLYDDLHQIARQRLYRERPNHTLGATALVNEMYLKLIKQQKLNLEDRNDFFAIASRTMRNILVDYARTKKRIKRGGDAVKVSLQDVEGFLSDKEATEVLALDAALDRLATHDERASKVVQYRFFGGLTLQETADALGLSLRTVQRSWTLARAWLRKEISPDLL